MYHHHDTTKKKIIGRKFLGAEKTGDSSIVVKYEGGSFSVFVEGDCCSKSVFYDLIIPPECVGEEILDCTEYEWLDPKLTDEEVSMKGFGCSTSEWDCLKIWDVVIYTKSGKVLLRHVNSSNGYYNGMTSYDFNN